MLSEQVYVLDDEIAFPFIYENEDLYLFGKGKRGGRGDFNLKHFLNKP